VLYIGVFAQVADQHYFVYASHIFILYG